MNDKPRKISAADIAIPADQVECTPTASNTPSRKTDREAVHHDIFRMLSTCGTTNRNEQLVAAIRALIAAGVDTKPRIVGAAMALGFDRGHAGSILSRSEGLDPARHKWERVAGVYLGCDGDVAGRGS